MLLVTWRHAALVVLAPLALGACASSYEVQPVDVATATQSLRDRSLSPEPVPPALVLRGEWLPVATSIDPADGIDLAEAGALALAYAPEILEARAEARVATAQLSVAGVPANPAAFIGPRYTASWDHLILPAALAFQFVLSDRLSAEKDLATEHHAAARHRVAATELDLLVDVRRAYIHVASLRGRIESLAGLAGTGDAAAERLRKRAAAGEMNPLESPALLLEIDEVAAERDALGAELAAAVDDLAARIGMMPGAAEIDTTTVDPLALPEPGEDARPQDLPDLLAIAADLRAAEQEIRRATEAMTPDLTAGPDFESDGGDKSTGVALEMELPIFRDGSAEVLAAMAERDAASARFDARLLTAHREIRARRAALEAAHRSERRHRSLVAGTVGVGEAALRRRLDAGEANMIDAAVLLASLASAVQRGVSLEESVAVARLELAAAQGALMAPRPAPNANEGGAR